VNGKTGSTVPRSADSISPTSIDAEFALVITACLIVHVALIVLLVGTWDQFARHSLVFVAAGEAALVVLARHIGRALRAASSQFSTAPPSIQIPIA